MITVINNTSNSPTLYGDILTVGKYFYFCDDENKNLCITTHDGYIDLVDSLYYQETPDTRKSPVKIIDDRNIIITWKE